MLDLNTHATRNILLQSLLPDDLAALTQRASRRTFPQGEFIVRAHKPIVSIVFPESGVLSIVDETLDGFRVELGLVGREGMSDGATLFDCDLLPYEIIVQVEAEGIEIPVADFRQCAAERINVRLLVERWLFVLSIQIGQTVVSNTHSTVEERLARWLVMCQDRLGQEVLTLTHGFLSIMLGVRRSSVTLATHTLEGANLIKAERGRITILDREALVAAAGSGYGKAEAEYERILGRPMTPFAKAAPH